MATAASKSVVKETLVSITIAFALAFVFRAFVVEAFVIPTGSMAPTLLGAHIRLTSPYTGYSWAMDAHQKPAGLSTSPYPVQTNIDVTDIMYRDGPVTEAKVPTRAGDRILVFKYLYSIYDPKRFDVVVFKSPEQPATNFIKRLVGLPGEQLALVDGDVFTRRPTPGEPPAELPWSEAGWRIQRKPVHVQRAVWQPVFDSTFAPPWTPGWTGPWEADPARWTIGNAAAYTCGAGADHAAIAWTADRRWAVDDYYPYNDYSRPHFPVSDVRMSMGVAPNADGLSVTAALDARGYEFRAALGNGAAALRMRPKDGNAGPDDNWVVLAQGPAPALRAGHVTDVEFWHVDQSLSLWAGGTRVLYAEYDWTPQQRLERATTWTLSGVVDAWRSRPPRDVLTEVGRYLRPALRWEFGGAGAGLTLYRVALARDLHYQASIYSPQNMYTGAMEARASQPANATHPLQSPILGPDQFFVCGDNSPASSDARLWDSPDPWVAATIDPTIGVVPRDLLIGKAFFVYFPALLKGERVPAPDFGRMRWIW
ncbi:MAG: signal peptidase I [Phycisphaerales bacterium]|nr:signal peptidase I [Phycisphaerales bacterium]